MPPYERPVDPPDYTVDELKQQEREREQYECDKADEEYDERNYN